MERATWTCTVALAATACGASSSGAGAHASLDATVGASPGDDASLDSSDAASGCSLLVDAAFESAAPDAASTLSFAVSCNQSPSLVEGGCTFDKWVDPNNCGSCGKSCDGGSCSDGSCVPLPGGVLATGQAGPVALAVDATNVYWINAGVPFGSGKQGTVWLDSQVMACPITGCGNRPTVLAGGWSQGMLDAYPATLAVDSKSVYWTGGTHVLSCATDGCGCAPSVVLPVGATGLAVSSGTLYWTDAADGIVGSCLLADCASGSTRAWSYQGAPSPILAVGGDVYFTAFVGDLAHCTAARCPCDLTTIWRGTGTEAQTAALAADATSLYWTISNPGGAGSVFRCSRSDCAATAVALADGLNAPRGIATDGTNVYWSESGTIYRCAADGCGGSPTVFGAAGGPAVAVDANHVYATTSDSILAFDK